MGHAFFFICGLHTTEGLKGIEALPGVHYRGTVLHFCGQAETDDFGELSPLNLPFFFK